MAWENVSLNATPFGAWAPDFDGLINTQAKRRDPLLQHSETTVFVMNGGTGDISHLQSAATILATMQTYASTARTAGADRVIVGTIPTWNVITGPMETERVALNNLIRAADDWDAVCDIAADPRFQDPDNTTYFVDGIHFADKGHEAAAELFGAVLDDVLVSL